MDKPLEVFCCYAHNDKSYLKELKNHLMALERLGMITIKADRDVDPGMDLKQEIDSQLVSAQIILLLVSSDFIASDYCYNDEMKQAMARHERGEACVIPILLRPGIWRETPFGKLQALPQNGRPVTEWRDRDTAWFRIAEGIEQIVKKRVTNLLPSSSRLSHNTDDTFLNNPGIGKRDWGEAPDVSVFFGRTKELVLLERWVLEERCRLIALVGMKGIGKTRLSVKLGKGGIGKTDLSLKLAEGIQEEFDYVIWRRLLNAPSASEIITDLIQFLSSQQEVHVPNTVSEQISRLLYYLRQHRCLVILDNVEMILQSGEHAGQYFPGYEGYGQLFEQIAETPHKSCVLVTSREKTPEIARLESRTGPVRSLEIRGLHHSDSKKIFAEIGNFSGSKEDWKQLNYLYNGNPLALELAAHHIREVFFGSISEFLREGQPIFVDLQSLLDWHFNRLSDVHKEIMYWFAITRKPITLSDLKEDILSSANKERITSTLHSLQKLIPLEKMARSFTLQPVLIEYMTQKFTEKIVEEIRKGEIHLFNTHAVFKTSMPDYIREIQSRLILKTVCEKLLEMYGDQTRLEVRLKEILASLRGQARFTSGYAGGNLLNFLCYLKINLRGYDFSSLAVWQTYLQGISVQDVNFAYADFSKSVFTNAFGNILCVTLSSQGDLLAAGTTKGELQLWNTVSGFPLQTIQGHPDWVWSIVFSPDGSLLASGSDDQTIRIWLVSSGQCLNILHGHKDTVWSVVFSPDGSLLASGSDDQTIRIWLVSNGQCLNILHGHTNKIRAVAISPNGHLLASGCEDKIVRLWDISSGLCLKELHGHTKAVRSVTFSPDGTTLASGSEDQTIRIWLVSNGQCLNILHGHTNAVRSVVFSPDGTTLASGSKDRKIRLWEASSGQCLNTLSGHNSMIRSVAFAPDGNLLASGSEDQTIRLWDISSGQCLKALHGYSNVVESITFSPDGSILASGNTDQMVHLWEITSGQSLNTLRAHSHWISSVAFSPDGRLLASGSNDQSIRLWEVSSGQCLATLHGHISMIRSVAFSPDGRLLASSSNDRSVRLWEVSSGQCLATLHGHSNKVRSVAFSPNGGILASGSYDQSIRLWEVSNGRCLNTLSGHSSAVSSVAFSPDGGILASGSYDQSVRLWKMDNGRCLNILSGHSSLVSSVAFSSNGSILASGSYDQSVRLWKMDNGRCLNTLSGHSHWISSVAFHPTDKTLASGSYDGTVHLWDVLTGTRLHTFRNDRPYERMNITQAKGLTVAQKATLKSLGAIESTWG